MKQWMIILVLAVALIPIEAFQKIYIDAPNSDHVSRHCSPKCRELPQCASVLYVCVC